MERRVLLGIVLAVASCLVWQAASQGVTCTAAGRVADPADTTCQNYTLCVFISANNSFAAYNYVCPTTSVFNPASGLCTAPTNYVCNVTAASVCTQDGFIADPNSNTCQTYVQCVSVNNSFTQTTIACPGGTLFDPATTLCETTYVCPTAAAAPTCTATGRFANTTDTTCQSYYMCVQATNGTFVQYNYNCPTTSVFNPNSRLCTAPANYVCTN